MSIPFPDYNLWRNIFWCSAHAECELVLIAANLGEPEISNFDVPLFVQQDVLWLDVSIDDVLGMEILDGQEQLGRVEPGSVLAELSTAPQKIEELPLIYQRATPGKKSTKR